MALASGARLGPYEIQSPLGAGGMGEVFRARDTRLDRTVAIKILSPTLAADPQFRERFEREARAVSALDHPNICALFDVGRETSPGDPATSVDYLVMQFVDGETLAKRLERGPLKIDQVMRLASEIASALDKAHRSGIVHRDLKPGNVMLTPTGAKLLDFGLARIVTSPAAGMVSAVPTVELTAPGSILGTFQYMAPEQLEGGDAGPRTDIFAFGALVYEAATGRKAFQGKSQATLIGAILRDDPAPISAVSQTGRPGSTATGTTSWSGAVDSEAVSAGLDRVVRRCLAKNPDDRWQTAADLLEALRWVAEGRAASQRAESSAGRRRTSIERAAWAALVIIAAAVATWGWLRPNASSPRTRFGFTLPEGHNLTGNGVAVSPDGRAIVVTGAESGRNMLYRRTVEQLEPVPIRGTEGGQYPFFSPDGQWLAFFTESGLKKIPAEGGPPSTIAPTGNRTGASWSQDQTIVFASGASPDLMRVSASGGKPEVLVSATLYPGATLRWPVWSADGRAVFFTVFTGVLGNARVAAYSLDTGRTHVVTEGSNPIALTADMLLFARGGSLWRARIDPRELTIGAEPPVPIVEGVQINTGGLALVAAAPAGTIAFRPGTAGETLSAVWATLDGVQQPLITKLDTYRTPRIAPDAQRLAVTIVSSGASTTEAESNIWVFDTRTEALSRVTFGAGRHTDPIWTPDGRRIIYASADVADASVRNLYWAPADGTGVPERLTTSPRDQIPRTISRDGRTVIFQERGSTLNWDLYVLSMDGERKAVPFVNSPTNEYNAAISPDGRFVAYGADETGRNEVYVRAFHGPAGKWQVSGTGGNDPVWSPDGKELYYWSIESASVVAVPVDIKGDTFTRGAPRVLFPYARPIAFPLSISPDGRRFALLQRPSGEDTPQVVVALNAFEK